MPSTENKNIKSTFPIPENRIYKFATLYGSEKQINWAEKIRYRVAGKLAEKIDINKRCIIHLDKLMNQKRKKGERIPDSLQDLYKKSSAEMLRQKLLLHDYMARNCASWIIENRVDFRENDIFEMFGANSLNRFIEESDPSIGKIFTLKKSDPGAVYVDLRVRNHDIQLFYPKDDRFIQLLKQHRGRWNGSSWIINLSKSDASAGIAAATLAKDLLEAGIAVRISGRDAIRKLEPMTAC